MNLPTTVNDLPPKPLPRVQAVQLHARLIFEDGTVVAMATVPSEINRDELDASISICETEVIDHVMAHAEALKDQLVSAGTEELYRTATRDTRRRRENAIRRAVAARKQKEAELQAGQPYREIGREKSEN
jgi:hypothetical protein